MAAINNAQTYNPNPYQMNNIGVGGYYYPQTQPQYNYIPQQQAPNNQQPNNQVQSDRIWAQGENAAKAYLVGKNTEQVIWDSEAPVIYIKTVDSYGRPNMLTLDYTIRQPEPQNSGVANTEINDLKNEMNELRNELKQFMQNNQRPNYNPKYNKKEVTNNES